MMKIFSLIRNPFIFFYTISFGVLICTQNLQPQHAWKRNFDIVHYRLNLNVNEKTRTLVGDITIKLLPTEQNVELIKLDATDLKVTDVSLIGRKLNFQLHEDKLVINLNQKYSTEDTLEIIISYSVINPKAGFEFMESDSQSSYQDPSMWSVGWSRNNHYWFPCYDNPDDIDLVTSEMIIIVPEYLKAISGGTLLSTTRGKKGTIIYHWYEDKPHATYNICLFITDYQEVKDEWNGIELNYYVRPDISDTLLRVLRITPQAMEFISSILDYPYPFEKYTQAVFEYALNNSNISATTLNHMILQNDGTVTIVHELAHQWFGTLLTCKNLCNVWLDEGFACYISTLFADQKGDTNFLFDHINQLYYFIIQGDNHPRYLLPTSRCDSLYSLSIQSSSRGEAVLHMLRFVLGDKLFWKGIRHYVKKHAFKLVTTDDFQFTMEEATCVDLDLFFKEFVYERGHHKYDVHHRWDPKAKELVMTVKRLDLTDSSSAFFPIPVDVEISISDTLITHQLVLSKPEEQFKIPAATAPQMVIFNINGKFLMEVQHIKSTEEWIYQMRHAKSEADRLDAITPLKDLTNSKIVADALIQVVLHDSSERVRKTAEMFLMFFKK